MSVRSLPTLVFVLTMGAGCGSGPSGPNNAPAEPPRTVVAQVPVDAAPVDASPPPRLGCEPKTVLALAPAPDPTWFCARADGTRHGPFITMFPDDEIEVAGSYKDGALAGPWARRNIDGAIVEEGHYAAGKKDGHWKQSSAHGTVLGEYDMAGGTGVEKV